ncbi:unnamed protein product [Caenorhabditis auriculariae]|uniref:DEAD/DEAH box helicase n=1 Tax=Caenorhabditis auriculariae TaxID=2777116 RepID=A0A8S1GVT6_9PELO|nr:unnamed protein product [Caenorhabditis auriculariae]
MSANWDDTDSENENVVVEEKPVILPRARQPSIAKSLEKAAILESSVHGSVKNDDSDSDALSVGSEDLDDMIDLEAEILTLDFDTMTNMKKIISQFECEYRNIVSEFADVEIFLISLDSLIIECAAHKYHNWQLAGQSIVLTKQVDRFLQQFVDLGGKFKLVVFTDLGAQFARDTILSFARATVVAHLASGPFAKDLVYFSSPADPNWAKYLIDLTPSFLMISTDNVTREVCAQEDICFTPQLETIVIDVLSRSIPIVPLFSISVNFVSVDAFYIQPRLVVKHNWDSFVAAHWDCNGELLRNAKNPSVSVKEYKNAAELWAKIIADAKASGSGSENFEALCCAVLLSVLVCDRRGVERVYLKERENVKRGLDVIRDRRLLLNTAAALLEKANFVDSKLKLADFWDGRMVFGIFDEICANELILPYRLQEEFAKLHQKAGLSFPLAVDTNERLFEPSPEAKDPLTQLPILYESDSPLFKRFVPEIARLDSGKKVKEGEVQDYAEYFQETMQWKLKPIEEEFAKPEEKIEDVWQRKRANKQRQYASRWYEMFANSLEGRGSKLLVDFSRIPKGFATRDDDENAGDDKKKGGKAWAGQKGGGGAKKGKEPAKSKKDLILEANKKTKDLKIIEGEKVKIKYGTQQGKDAISFLEKLYSSLDLPESRALCAFEITIREARYLFDHLQGANNMEARRNNAINLVGHLKNCFVEHWQHLEDKQKDQVTDLWVSLGFDAPAGSKPSSEAKSKKLDLGINMIYYQLQYAGELIDIHSDPKKDDRVSGFAPDAWQRRMLDSVDRGNSALIVAPTSAGKTFVSYYCIEKVLRSSDDDVVVYISPSKALINQVCGSVYARFRQKSMTRGQSLFGTLTPDYGQSPLNCQVLVTVPESFQELLLSRTPAVQEFVSHIKYVVFDEVHSIGASEISHIWEQLLLLIQCPFLALSATIGNANKLHQWLNDSEVAKSGGKRKVDLIVYGERYSELELSILNIDKPKALNAIEGEEANEAKEKKETSDVIQPLMPYGVYMPEKLRMFSIPDDQQLTARQILHLYSMLADVDEKSKKEFEPCRFFGLKPNQNVWISRENLRNLENKLKERFLEWLEGDEKKLKTILSSISKPVDKQLEYRAVPFNMEEVASDYITPMVDELRQKNMLPAICFNDARHVCETMALRLCEELEKREEEFVSTADFKAKYAMKDEEKLLKLAKRKRDAADKKKKSDREHRDEDAGADGDDDSMGDALASQKARIAQVLEQFKVKGRRGDPDVYTKMVERMQRNAKSRESTKLLLRLFERGIGFHHGGLNMVEKGAVEVLFREGHLGIIFSTSTLALGVNMPCKSVIFGVDTPMLTPLLYRQMSGRAGRRGFDHSGTVIFMAVPTSKMRRLLTASLSNLQGNPPFTVTFLLRLLAYVHQKDVKDSVGQPITNIKQRAHTAMSLLNHSFSLVTRREAQEGHLPVQLRMFSAFALQLLRHLQLVTPFGAAKNLAELAMHLQAGESGTLLFIYLLQKGCFHRLVKAAGGPEKAKKTMLLVLANLFTTRRMSASYNPDEKTGQEGNLQVVLSGLPSELQQHAKEYNQLVTGIYKKCLAAASKDGNLVDPVFRATGLISDDSFSISSQHLVSPVYEGYSHDESFLPVLDFDRRDHRGRKIYLNAFAIDFFTHGSRELLRTVNDLPISQMWFAVHDFVVILQRLSAGMEAVARPQDAVAAAIKELFIEYDDKFRSVFGMRSRD